jgi:SnoaL-like domain
MKVVTQLPAGARGMIDATNSGDREALLACFTPDGVVDDFGRTFTGPAKIAAWDEEGNIGARAHVLVQHATVDGTTCTVAVSVSGQGYNGPSTFRFELDGPLVRRLTITA